jgi:hypothetical protein
MDSIWKPVSGYNGYYEVSNKGEVRALRGHVLRKPQINNSGYYCLNLSKKGKQKGVLIHRLVANAFIPNPEKKEEVNHKDFDKSNNCVSNLEWVSKTENLSHSYEKLGYSYGEASENLKIRVLNAKKELPRHGVTALFFHYFKDFKDTVKNKSKLNNVLQTRATDEDITLKLEELVLLLKNE